MRFYSKGLELIRFKVLEALGKGFYRVLYKGRNLIAKSRVPLYPGDIVILKKGDIEFPFEVIERSTNLSTLLKSLNFPGEIPYGVLRSLLPPLMGKPEKDAEILENVIHLLSEKEGKSVEEGKVIKEFLNKTAFDNILNHKNGFVLEFPVRGIFDGLLKMRIKREGKKSEKRINYSIYLSINFSDGIAVKVWMGVSENNIKGFITASSASLLKSMEEKSAELYDALRALGFENIEITFVMRDLDLEEKDDKFTKDGLIIDFRI